MSIERAAVKWWRMKRPAYWRLAEHLENPDINCYTEVEMQLAEAVAAELLRRNGDKKKGK